MYVLKTAYQEFENRVGQLQSPRGSKIELVESTIEGFNRESVLSDLEKACSRVIRDMIRIVLRDLRQAGKIECPGRGPGTLWKKKGNIYKRASSIESVGNRRHG